MKGTSLSVVQIQLCEGPDLASEEKPTPMTCSVVVIISYYLNLFRKQSNQPETTNGSTLDCTFLDSVNTRYLLDVNSPFLWPLDYLNRSGHYDPDAVRACAQTVALHWQTLMLRIEDRLKLVNASAAFYRTSQQVKPSSTSSWSTEGSTPTPPPHPTPHTMNTTYMHVVFIHVVPGVWRPGESGAGVPQGGGLVWRRREAAWTTVAAHQQTHGTERGIPEGENFISLTFNCRNMI